MENLQAEHPDNPFEKARLEDLHNAHIMDSHREMCFDLLTEMASIVCQTPIALLSFINSNRQWFKSCVGIELHELPKHLTPCNATLNRTGGYYQIEDSHQNSEDCDYHEYLKEIGLRFYFGVPVYSAQGNSLGTLCVLDKEPRKLDSHQIETLKLISKEITDLIEIRRGYMKNLERLNELSEDSYFRDKVMQDRAHKVAHKAIAEVSAGIIYHIRPLAMTVQNIAENLMELKEDEKVSVPSRAELLKDCGRQINEILNSLEKYLSSEKEKWMKTIDVIGSLDAVLTQLEHKIVKNNITVLKNYEIDLRVIGNSAQIAEVFFHVLNNSIEAVERTPQKIISVTVREENRQALIIIEDTGYGVPEDIEPFIFQPFFTTKGPTATGIGLSLTAAHLQNHSGSIRLTKNFSPTTFEIRIPLP